MYAKLDMARDGCYTKLDMARDGCASLLGTSHKIDLSDQWDEAYLSTILYLAAYKTAVDGIVRNLCPMASQGCAEGCLKTAGHGGRHTVQEVRIARTKLYWRDRARFVAILLDAIHKHRRKARRLSKTPVVRLNGTSDIGWETMGILEQTPDVIYYDYTKHVKRMKRYVAGELPDNYSLTFSRSEDNDTDCAEVLAMGGTVAMVWRSYVPTSHVVDGIRYEVIDGTKHDLRFLDKPGVIVGLRALAKAKYDKTGFVLEN